MMTTPALIAMFIGAAAGMRCNVLILAPMLALGSIAGLIVSLAHNNDLWSTVPAVGLMLAALQVGYLAGVAARVVMTKLPGHKALPMTLAPARRAAR